MGCAPTLKPGAQTAGPQAGHARPTAGPAHVDEGSASPAVAEPVRSTPHGAGAGRLEALCVPDFEQCSRYLELEELAEQGELETLGRLLPAAEEPDATVDAPSVQHWLRARLLLESGSLSYGEGGPEASRALESLRVGLEDCQARPRSFAQVPGLCPRLELDVARALLALGRGEAALGSLQRLAQRYSGEPEVQAALGIAYLSVGRVLDSLGPLRRAAQLDDGQAERHLVLGTAQMLNGQYAEAEGSFRAALARHASARAHGDLGAVLLLLGRLEEGRSHLERAAALAPSQATYLANLAYAELLLKRPEQCERQARAALALEPRLAAAWLNLGLCLVELGQRAAARDTFHRALSLDPTDPRPKNSLKDLDELERSKLPE